jgi:hypothetical protein
VGNWAGKIPGVLYSNNSVHYDVHKARTEENLKSVVKTEVHEISHFVLLHK